MRWLATSLMIVGIALSVYGAASAYYVSIDEPDAVLQELTLNDSAGAKLGVGEELEPVAVAGQKLDPQVLAALRENRVGIPGRVRPWRYVRVREFAWSRWPGRWLAVGGAGILLAGALLARRQSAEPSTMPDDGSILPIDSATVSQLAAEINSLPRQLAGTDQAVRQHICESTEALQRKWIIPMMRSRDTLVARYSIGRAAGPLTNLAGTERSLWRAWSAAADGYPDEATESLLVAGKYCRTAREELEQLESL